jgi:hypothetical protein
LRPASPVVKDVISSAPCEANGRVMRTPERHQFTYHEEAGASEDDPPQCFCAVSASAANRIARWSLADDTMFCVTAGQLGGRLGMRSVPTRESKLGGCCEVAFCEEG